MNKPLVFVIAAMPPPVHGQSAVTANIVNMLFQSPCRTVLADTSPQRLERSLAYHFIRLRKLSVAILRLFAASFRRSKRAYTVVESGAGIAYNLLAVLLCRALGYELFLHHHTARHIARRSGPVILLTMLAGQKATHIVLFGSYGCGSAEPLSVNQTHTNPAQCAKCYAFRPSATIGRVPITARASGKPFNGKGPRYCYRDQSRCG